MGVVASASASNPDVTEVIDRPETVLEMARRHVLEGEERLARQVALVAKLERASHTDAAAMGSKVRRSSAYRSICQNAISMILRGGRNVRCLNLTVVSPSLRPAGAPR